MRALTRVGARHFVSQFAATPGASTGRASDFVAVHLGRVTSLSEGDKRFEEWRDCLLREADRDLVLSANCYVRALEGLRAASTYWTIVSLYYAAFFAARAIMGMLGCWIKSETLWSEMDSVNPGAQRVAIWRGSRHRYSNLPGSHRNTWKAFYSAVAQHVTWASPAAAVGLTPVSQRDTWLSEVRNAINYESFDAFAMCRDFEAAYDPSNVPTCFQGKLMTMWAVARAILAFGRELADDVRLATDVSAPYGSRAAQIRALVTSPPEEALARFAASERGHVEF